MLRFPLLSSLIVVFVCSSVTAQKATKTQPPKKRRNPVLAPITDQADLPRVLLIGDSISMGYTLPTRTLLSGKANVHRIPTNGGPTTRGVEMIDAWLGNSQWDVIHFNWGLHDLKYLNGKKQVSLKDYETNLRHLVKRLQKTGATLIWCNTTPVPSGVSPPRKTEEVLEYNAVAEKIMKKHNIRINDLYSYANGQLDQIQRPKNVHFTPAGSAVLAKQVAKEIRAALKK